MQYDTFGRLLLSGLAQFNAQSKSIPFVESATDEPATTSRPHAKAGAARRTRANPCVAQRMLLRFFLLETSQSMKQQEIIL